MSETIEARALRWACGDDTGLSSKAILNVMTGSGKPSRYNYPRDDEDFGRCHRLLNLIPEWRERMTEMSIVGPEWAALAPRWSDLTEAHEQRPLQNARSLIRAIIDPIQNADPNVIKFGGGELIMGGRKP
jgi:hypothetical protein